MNKRARLEVAPYLSVDELLERYLVCKDTVEKLHWQAVWLKARGRSTGEVARMVGFKPDWIRQLVRRFNTRGPLGLRVRPRAAKQ